MDSEKQAFRVPINLMTDCFLVENISVHKIIYDIKDNFDSFLSQKIDEKLTFPILIN